MFTLILATFVLLATASLPVFDPPELEITTTYGPVVGHTIMRGDVREWLGIRYAATTAYANRFRPPQPPTPWETPYVASQFGNYCPQGNIYVNVTTVPPMIGSEDCLFLNIWAPLRGNNLDVVVIVHGGGQNTGSGGNDLTGDGQYVLAQQYSHGQFIAEGNDVIVVSFNYRLNIFGFLNTNDLSLENYAEIGQASSGGYGNLDQIAVLKWIQDNIEEFGGNPDRVSILGVSGGATACASLLSTPLTHNSKLFDAAWIASALTNHMSNQTTQEARYQSMITDSLNCSGYATQLECLRGVSQQELYDALAAPYVFTSIDNGGIINFPFGLGTPSAPIGGYILPYRPEYTLAQTSINDKVRVIVGSVNLEMSYLLLTPFPSRSFCSTYAYQYASAITGKPSSNTGLIDWVEEGLGMYPDTPLGWVQCVSDITYLCSAYHLAEGSAEGDRKTWRYVFEYNVLEGMLPYAIHGDDNYFITGVLGDTAFFGPYTPKDDAYWLADIVQDNIAEFTSKNNVGYWPRYKSNNKRHMTYNNPLSIGSDFRATECGYWNAPPAL